MAVDRWVRTVDRTPETIGQVLKRLRNERGVTQEQVAAATGLNQNSFSAWEIDRHHPTNKTLRVLAAYYGVDYGWLDQVNYDTQRRRQSPPEPLPSDGLAIGPVDDEIMTLLQIMSDDQKRAALLEFVRENTALIAEDDAERTKEEEA